MPWFQHRKPCHKLSLLHNNETLYHTTHLMKLSYDKVCSVKISDFSTDSLLLWKNQHLKLKYKLDVRMWHLYPLLVQQT